MPAPIPVYMSIQGTQFFLSFQAKTPATATPTARAATIISISLTFRSSLITASRSGRPRRPRA